MKNVSHRSTPQNTEKSSTPSVPCGALRWLIFFILLKTGINKETFDDEPDIVGQSCRIGSHRSYHRIGHHLRCEPDQSYGKLAVEPHCGRFRVVFRRMRRLYRRRKTEEPVDFDICSSPCY